MAIKVIIADDEFLVRIGIKSVVPWQKLGMEVIAEAEDGQEALEMYNIHNPDIVITDIRMPKLDGLEFTKQIKQISPRTKVIILTCHGEFSYAKEALRLGAFDFVLKPTMMTDELTEILDRAGKIIEQEQEELLWLNEMRRKLQAEERSVKIKVLQNALTGQMKEESLEIALKNMGILLHKDHIAIIISQIDNLNQVMNSYRESSSSQMFWDTVQNIVFGIIRTSSSGTAFIHRSQCVSIISFNGTRSEKEIYENIYALASQIQTSLYQFLGIHTTIGVSETGHQLSAISTLNIQAETACHFRYFLGRGQLIHYREIVDFKQSECDYALMLTEIEYKIQELNLEDVKMILNELFLIRLLPTYNRPFIKNVIFQLLTLYASLTKEIKISDQLVTKYELYEVLNEFETLDEVHKWFQTQFQLLIEARIAARSKLYCYQVNKAIEFIERHYAEDIGLSDVSEAIQVSRNYLGNLFKRDTGCYFIEYLTVFRLEKAKQLLRDPALKVYEIASKSGFQDQRYFSKVFKKYTGYSPNEYREI